MDVYDKLLKFVGLRPRSGKEIKDWFARKKVVGQNKEDLFDRLKQLGLVNDLEFAKWWVEQRVAFRPRGRKALVYELRAKGVSEGTITKALEESGVDEKTLALDLLKRKPSRWRVLDVELARRQMTEFLSRRGFDWQTAKSAIDAFLSGE